jgi:hypothetical protein
MMVYPDQKINELVAENANLRDALLDATAHLAAATSAYEKFVGRHDRRGRADALFNTRIGDFKGALERVRLVLNDSVSARPETTYVWNKAIELAAALIETHEEATRSSFKRFEWFLQPRTDGNETGLTFAKKLRSMML